MASESELASPKVAPPPSVVAPVIVAPMKNKIQVSNTKKPLYFYVSLAKWYMKQHDEAVLSALGMAIVTVVKVAEILKNKGLATKKKIATSTVETKDETRGRIILKAKIEIILEKTEKFDSLITATDIKTKSKSSKSKKSSKPKSTSGIVHHQPESVGDKEELII